ncbi:MAG: ATP phosphoribosyltransferase regulatory subunit [Eubacteriales bacterium]|nr:ATP phosphoribosyltransferase regulatory subunit [Eubacteriales bacterium]
MNPKKIQLPGGVSDALPAQQAALRRLTAAALDTFASWGYQEVGTPNLEYADVFTGEAGNYEQEQMFKLTDANGRMLALRPDFTLPMARIAASKCKEQDCLRLCYAGTTYRFDGWEAAGGLKECTQLGAERMGEGGPEADAEMIALAITALQSVGLEDFQIELGQVEFFKGLMEEAGFSLAQAEQVRLLVESKNALAIELLMQNARGDARILNTIRELPALYGGPEVLERAWDLCANARCRAAVSNLREILSILDDFGLSPYVSVDLGMVNSLNYYTGMILRGISRRVGYPVLTGGRYDSLTAEFGRPMAATGFAFAAQTMLYILAQQGTAEQGLSEKILLFVQPAHRQAAFETMRSLRRMGIRVEQDYGGETGLTQRARSREAKPAVFDQRGLTMMEGEPECKN